MVHFPGLILCSPTPSVDTGECIVSCVALEFRKNLLHPRTATYSSSFSAMSEERDANSSSMRTDLKSNAATIRSKGNDGKASRRRPDREGGKGEEVIRIRV